MWVSPHTLHLSNVVQQENQRRKTFKKIAAQQTTSDTEDQQRARMGNQAKCTTLVQLHNREEQERATGIGTEARIPAKKTHFIWSDIPHWSRKSLDQHVKKVEENLELIKSKEEDAKVFVGNNTHQRDDINRLSQILEGHLKRVTNITFE